jgi:arginine decarboxylase
VSFWRSVHELADETRPAFHMPGHGQRSPLTGPTAAALDDRVFALDQSEMAGLDYLHEPSGPLAASQERAARVFGADRSWYLVNGATVGNLAALWSVARPGGRVLALRRSHQSVHAAMTLAGLEPHYLQPIPDVRLQGLFGIDIDALRTALEQYDDVVAVHVTSPDYYGFRLPLAQIAALAHAHGVPLIVDEAHGAHLGFVPGEEGALAAGADLVVHSPHKALGSLTQSAVLHLRGARVDPDRVSEALVLLQSSSPSALLTMSLDAVVEELDRTGPTTWTDRAALARDAAAQVGVDGLPLLSARSPLPRGVSSTDPCKLVVEAHRYGLSVEALRAALAERGIRPEFTDRTNVVLSVTAGTTAAHVALLLDVLQTLAAAATPADLAGGTLSLWPDSPAEQAMPAREALQSDRAVVPLDAAAGLVVAAPLTPYPPGIPLVLPGEVLSPALVATVQGFLAAGVTVRGLVRAPSGALAVRCAMPAPVATAAAEASR